MNKSNKINGFSLIELLVVISIIGILATLALTSFTGAQRQTRDTKRKSDIKQYQTLLETTANNKNGFYPVYTSSIDMSTTLCTLLGQTGCPTDPKSADSTYRYRYISNGSGVLGNYSATNYVMNAKLENAKYFVVCSNGKIGEVASSPTSSTCPL